jgi:hypothetical protein
MRLRPMPPGLFRTFIPIVFETTAARLSHFLQSQDKPSTRHAPGVLIYTLYAWAHSAHMRKNHRFAVLRTFLCARRHRRRMRNNNRVAVIISDFSIV